MQKHLQALAAVGCSKPGMAQGARRRTRTELPHDPPHCPCHEATFSSHKNIVIWSTKHFASSRASTRNCNYGSTKWHRRRCIYGEPAKPGRNTTKIRFLQEAQCQTSFSKAPLRKLRQRTCYETKSSHWYHCQARRAEISLEEKQTTWQLFIATQTSSHLVFCWCNTDHMCLQPEKEKLPARSRKAEINLVSHR